ncbi:concanavalin A-like lectin/glucanase domain-containing protein [Lentinula aciculospora]|uniref:Concanavalin A-like lectin/glucanase domain-containing protein n=1 Tax=Lentinula aciculospora TaxID=153920 RepID=A0A9W8ZZB4_9AGAR|nr:concanavalin A-like lectin/glucanase domain-containing protein [Lentinula aciculospora]
MLIFLLLLLLTGLFPLPSTAIYTPLREYAGDSFFSGWDYYGNVDNTTLGNVTYVNQSTGVSQSLTYVDSITGHAIIRVDNFTNIPNASIVNRNSVKITTKEAYPVGSLVIIDAWHIPYGCSVWPAFWTLGINLEWPQAGEMDIIEAINNLGVNQYALHTSSGCSLPSPSSNSSSSILQSGNTIETNCTSTFYSNEGCLVQESKPNSFGAEFAEAQGGVFATQLDVSGIYIWFWSRSNIPAAISQANSSSKMDISSDWGTPTVAVPSSGCNITQYFQAQQLVLDITLCGVWAGVQSIYSSSGCSGQCIDNVIGAGNPTYNDAYWDIAYIRTYLSDTVTTTNITGNSSSTSSISTLLPSSSAASSGNDANSKRVAAVSVPVHGLLWFFLLTLFGPTLILGW